jgi:hypothetical protein
MTTKTFIRQSQIENEEAGSQRTNPNEGGRKPLRLPSQETLTFLSFFAGIRGRFLAVFAIYQLLRSLRAIDAVLRASPKQNRIF